MEELTARELCLLGKEAFFHHDGDVKKRELGLQLLLRAQRQNDPEALYVVAQLLLDGVLSTRGVNSRDQAMTFLCTSADLGWPQARAWLNRHCNDRYRQSFPGTPPVTGPLVDFQGEPIRISRTGLMTPVDAVLSYENGKNILTLSANIHFLYSQTPEDPERYEQLVLAGFREWSGHYTVFGGQQLTVRVALSREKHFFDHLTVVAMDKDVNDMLLRACRLLGNEQATDIALNRRSFASMRRKWSASSRKTIWLQETADDPVVLMQTAKHEFGHVLGLGDLYESPTDDLAGVQAGTYPELDSYALTDKLYHLVMCTSAGPVSNNDIEMVVLAFAENRAQLYQDSPLKGKISEALGKGN